MKVLFISGREPTYMRNAVILKALNELGMDIIECTSRSNWYLIRYLEVLFLYFINRKGEFDLLFVGYFGQPLIPILKKLTHKPIIFDAFLSSYDTMCFDRKKFKPSSLGASFFYWLDRYSCQCSDIVLLDTEAHIDYFVRTFGLKRDKFRRLFVGADTEIFRPTKLNINDENTNVLYWSTYHPLHGVEYIVLAASKLREFDDIKFEIVGNGMEYEYTRTLINKLNLQKSVKLIDRIPSNTFYKTIAEKISISDICLGGHFSDVDKAKRVIAEKTFEFIAMKKPVIVGDNPANRELFYNKKNALLVEHANADALADAILLLKNNKDLRTRIAEEGYRTFKERCTTQIISKDLKSIIEDIISYVE